MAQRWGAEVQQARQGKGRQGRSRPGRAGRSRSRQGKGRLDRPGKARAGRTGWARAGWARASRARQARTRVGAVQRGQGQRCVLVQAGDEVLELVPEASAHSLAGAAHLGRNCEASHLLHQPLPTAPHHLHQICIAKNLLFWDAGTQHHCTLPLSERLCQAVSPSIWSW